MYKFKKKPIIASIGIMLTLVTFGGYFSQNITNVSGIGDSNIVKSEKIDKDHTYNKEKISGYNIEYIKVNNSKDSNYKIKIGISKEGGEFLGDMIKNSSDNVISAMNGAYFSPKAYGNDINETWANRISGGKSYSKTQDLGIRELMGFDDDGNTIMLTGEGVLQDFNKNNPGKIKEGISNFPGLLKDGVNITNNWSEYITDKMKLKKDKTFLCSDNNKNVYFGVIKKISIESMSEVLIDLGCKNALNMDAGASTELIYNLNKKISSWTPVMDGIFVIKKDGLSEEEIKKKENLGSGIKEKIKYGIYNSFQKTKRLFK